MKVWVCAVAKMEEPYIREWVEWYHSIGVDHIVIGDNNDKEYDKDLSSEIQDYIDKGFVEVIDKKGVLNVQQPFYNEIYHERKNDFDWIGFFDIDEFLDLPSYSNVHDFLADENFKDVEAVVIPWLIYTDSRQLHYENKPVMERFTEFWMRKKTGVKHFLKSLNTVKRIISEHNPEACQTHDGHVIVACDSIGDKNFKRVLIEGKGRIAYTMMETTEEHYKKAYIKHYITRSTEEFIFKKMLRGRGARAVGNYVLRYTTNLYFYFNKRTKEKEEMFKKYADIIKESQQKELDKYKK